MLTSRTWKGYWISDGRVMPKPSKDVVAAPYLRKTVSLPAAPEKATIYLAGPGWHELYVNGRKVDDRVLAPTVTQYDKRASYIEYEATTLLREGANVIVVVLGNGWYNCHTDVTWGFEKAPWRDWPKLRCDIEVDGQIVAQSDRTWKHHDGPTIFDALRNGEHYDARREIPGLFESDFDDSGWSPASIANPPPGPLCREELEPCKVMRRYAPVGVTYRRDRTTVYDFGTNLTGWARIRLRAAAGTRIEMAYGELIRPVSGELDQEYIGKFVTSGAFQTDVYIAGGAESGEVWEPRFTYHGFRYVRGSFADGIPDAFDIEACFVHNSFPEAGAFASSDPMLDRLQEITRQSYLSNFTGIPTDCPHREKNDWTGDAALAMETGLWNFQASKACSHFLRIVADTQRPTGQLSGIAPTGGWGYNWGSGPAWDIALFEIPWQIHLFTGDRENIREHYEACAHYLEYCREYHDEGRLLDFGLGDWCPVENSRMAPVVLTSTGYCRYAANRMADFARILGKTADAAKYTEFSGEIRAAFNQAFRKEDGDYGDGSVTALSAALYFGCVDVAEAPGVAARLAAKVRGNGHKADFGILGAKYIPRMLAEYGYIDDAHRLITQPEFPGWGFWVKSGATTLWEHWRGSASQNHMT